MAEMEAPRPQAEASATVTVTAEAAPVELVQTPNPVIVIDKAAIERRGAATLGELLQDVLPGEVFASGGVGTSASISLGGTRPQDTVVTLDGLRLMDASGLGGVNPNIIQLAGIDRIEIQQGPASTRFGSDATGGAVALYSAAGAPAGFSGEARAAAGNEGIRKGSLAAAYGWDQGWIRVAGTAMREDQVLDPANPYRSTGTFVGLGQQAGENTLFTLNYFNSYAGVPIPIAYSDNGTGSRSLNPGQFDPNRQDFNRSQILSGTVRTQFSPVLTGELTVGQVLQTRLEPDLGSGAAPVPYSSSRNQMVGHVTWQPSDSASVTLGLDGSEESAKSPDPNDFTEQAMLSATARHLAVLAEGQKELFPGFRAVLSLRSEWDRQSLPAGAGDRTDNSNAQTTGKLGANWTLPAGFRVYANAGTGFSNPLLFNSVWNAQFDGARLNNEKSRTAQAGIGYAKGPWKASLEFSRTLFSDLVYYNYAGGRFIPAWGMLSGIYQNANSLRAQSAELKAGYETATWGAGGFYRNQEARDLQAPAGQAFYSISAVLRKPFQTLGANAFRVLGDFRLEGRWSWTGPRYDYFATTPNAAFKEHYNDLSLSVAWALRQDLSLTLRGDNLMQPNTTQAQWLARARDFQNDASQIFGYPAQPPTVTAEVRYRF
jgi:vitamin B12 transporter